MKTFPLDSSVVHLEQDSVHTFKSCRLALLDQMNWIFQIHDHNGTNAREDMAGAEESAKYLESLIEEESATTPRNRIMIGGFSQVHLSSYRWLLK